MTLDQYLSLPGKTAAQLASDAETTGATITRARKGEQNLTLDLARRIVSATDGMVTLDDLATPRAA